MGVWSTVESTIESWIAGQLPAGWKVIFAEQQGGMPEASTVTIRIGDPKALGACDEETNAYNGGAPLNDLTITESGPREFGISFQAYGGKGQTTGDNSPRAVLSVIRQSLELPTIRYTLQHTAGLSPFDNRGPVRNVAAVAGTIFEPRALWECRFYVVESISATTTYIETVDAGVNTPGPQEPIPGILYGDLPSGLPLSVG